MSRPPAPDGTDIEYVIDPQNRRIGKQVDGQLTQGFLWQGQLAPVAELDSLGNVVSRFVYATRVNVPDYIVKNDTTYRLVLDHLGSVRLVVNIANDSVVQRLDYDEFGIVTTNTNPAFQPFGFAGGLYDEQTGLVRFGVRDYEPEAGRWTAKDPMEFAGGDPNLYSYTLVDPVNLIDASGECPWCIGAVIGAGFDLVSQLIENGGNLRCVSLGRIAVSAALGAVGGGLGGRGLTGSLRSLTNATKGRIGEALSLANNWLKGSRLVTRQARLVPGLSTRFDSVWRSVRGGIYFVESKFGTSTLTSAQRAAANALGELYHVERWGYPFFGRVGGYIGGAAGAAAGSAASAGDCGCR